MNKIKSDKRKTMKTKTLVAIIGVFLCGVIVFATPTWSSTILFSVATALMAYEFAVSTGYVKNRVTILFSILQASVIPWLFYYNADMNICLIFLFVFTVGVFFFSALSKVKNSDKGILSCFAAAYIFPVFLSLLVPMLKMPHGKLLVALAFIIAWIPDSFAYTVGSFFGKHKLAPTVSPNKTFEGAIAGLVGGTMVVCIFGFVLTRLNYSINWLWLIIMGIFGILLGILGDLFLSYIKRQCSIKDFGKLLPGHGGVLDRFDSVLFVVPFCYIIFQNFAIIS